MRISIYNQFSSNHSAGFDILGEFQSEADAEVVAAELQKLDEDIIEYRRKKMSDECDRLTRERITFKRDEVWLWAKDQLSEPEIQFAKKHGLAPFHLGFVAPSTLPDPDFAYHLGVSRLGKFVYTTDAGLDTWVTRVPSLEQYFEKSGARIITATVADDSYNLSVRIMMSPMSKELWEQIKDWWSSDAEPQSANEKEPRICFNGSMDDLFEGLKRLSERGCDIISVSEIKE